MDNRIGEFIDKSGYKKKFIAESLRITPTQLSNWISGRSYPSVPKLFALADLLEVKVDELYGRTKD
jgi:putative transcriptional regulator